MKLPLQAMGSHGGCQSRSVPWPETGSEGHSSSRCLCEWNPFRAASGMTAHPRRADGLYLGKTRALTSPLPLGPFTRLPQASASGPDCPASPLPSLGLSFPSVLIRCPSSKRLRVQEGSRPNTWPRLPARWIHSLREHSGRPRGAALLFAGERLSLRGHS